MNMSTAGSFRELTSGTGPRGAAVGAGLGRCPFASPPSVDQHAATAHYYCHLGGEKKSDALIRQKGANS